MNQGRPDRFGRLGIGGDGFCQFGPPFPGVAQVRRRCQRDSQREGKADQDRQVPVPEGGSDVRSRQTQGRAHVDRVCADREREVLLHMAALRFVALVGSARAGQTVGSWRVGRVGACFGAADTRFCGCQGARTHGGDRRGVVAVPAARVQSAGRPGRGRSDRKRGCRA